MSRHDFHCKQVQIGSIRTLAKTLSLTQDELLALADSADNYYQIAKEIPKADGSVRRTYRVLYPLKKVLIRIRNRIISNVTYPQYILAGLQGKSYLDNAKEHKSSTMIMSEDISRFFDSIQIEYVEQLFKYFFRFPDDVAICLSKLCTNKGYLVQGSTLSGDIANLIFHEKEPKISKIAATLDLKYTRYYDDIYVSSKNDSFYPHVGALRSAIYGMFASVGVQPNKAPNKSRIMRASSRMDVHDVTVNSHKISPSRARTANVRLQIQRLRVMVKSQAELGEVLSLYRSTFGKLVTLKSQGSPKYTKMQSELDEVIKLIEPARAKKYARKYRKVKNKSQHKSFANKVSPLKKISLDVAGVINAEARAAKARLQQIEA